MQRLERGENAAGAGIHADGRDIAPADDSGFVDHEERALAGSVLGGIDPVGARDGPLWLEIGEKWKAELPVFREGDVAPGTIDGYAEKLGPEALELGQHLLVERHLVAADRAPVGRVEGENDGPPPEVLEADRLIGGRVQREIRSLRARLKRFHPLLLRLSVCRGPLHV